MPPSGMRRVLFTVLLISIALQGSEAASGRWFDWFQGRLDVVQQQVQQRQAEFLQQRLAEAADSVSPPQRRLMQEPGAAAATGSYGYGYGYGNSYGNSEAGSAGSSSGRRLQETPGLAPTLVYDDEHIEQVRLIGEAHADGIELEADAPVPAPALLEQPVEIRAARKLLVTASDISVAAVEQAVMPVAPIILEPEDTLPHGRSLLQDTGLTGSYGGYGYGYGNGGYGTEAVSGRSLLEAVDVDDVKLYNIWLQKHLQQRNH